MGIAPRPPADRPHRRPRSCRQPAGQRRRPPRRPASILRGVVRARRRHRPSRPRPGERLCHRTPPSANPLPTASRFAFMVANIAIDLDAMRLATWRAAAARMRAGRRPRAPLTSVHAPHRLGRGATPWWPRLRRASSTTSGGIGTCVGQGMIEGGPRMIDLEIPSSAHCSPSARGHGRGGLLADLAQVRPGRAHLSRRADVMAALIDGLGRSGSARGAARPGSAKAETPNPWATPACNGANLSSVPDPETARGDVGSHPRSHRQGLGNVAIAAVATTNRSGGMPAAGRRWRSPSPINGSDSGAIRTTAVRDGDHYVLNGEKDLRHRGRKRAELVVAGDADRFGKQAIKSRRRAVQPGPADWCVRSTNWHSVPDTAAFVLEDRRAPEGPARRPRRSGPPQAPLAGATADPRQHPARSVAAMAPGPTQSLQYRHPRVSCSPPPGAERSTEDRPERLPVRAPAAQLIQMEADHAAARLLTLRAAWPRRATAT